MTALISQLTETVSINNADWIEVEIAASGLSRKIQRSNLIGGTISGGGALVTGGFTLTVPATGVASLLGTAQTYSALKTFGAGLSFGAQSLTNYTEDVWTPAVTGSTGDPTITYTTQVGRYTRIGNVVLFAFFIVIDTVSGGSGILRVSLPITVSSGSNGNVITTAYTSGVNLADTPATLVFAVEPGAARGAYLVGRDNTGGANPAPTDLSANDQLWASGFYFV